MEVPFISRKIQSLQPPRSVRIPDVEVRHDAYTGVMWRNLHNAGVTAALISLLFPNGTRFLDYAGGYGTLVRLMRGRGFDFYWSDPYAKNLHARGFEHVPGSRYDLLTASEVLEHLPNPLEDIACMLDLADNVLVTTELFAGTRTRASELVVLRRKGWAAYLVLQRGFSAENRLPLSRVSFVAGFISSVHAKAAKQLTVSDRDQRSGGAGCQLVMQARKSDAD